jgi:cell wall-associated NlpC family hydrolase
MRRLTVPFKRLTVVAAALALFGAGVPALAEPNDSDPAVAEARRQEQLAAASVSQVEGMLDTLRAHTEQAEAAAGLAAEAFNQAQVDLDAATQAAKQAKQKAEQADKELGSARSALARVAMATSLSDGGVSQLEPFLSKDGFEETVDRATMLEMVGSTTERAAKRLSVAQQAADAANLLAGQAEQLRAERADAQKQKAQAAQQAADAAAAQQAAAEQEHTRLLQVLADKKKTTVDAERAAEQRRIDEANRKAEEERQRQQQAAMNPPAAPSGPSTGGNGGGGGSTTPPPSSGGSGGGGNSGGGNGGGNGGGGSTTPPPPSGGGGSSASAGQAALDWARQQIGKPYGWGGTGPNSFDCSGLVMMAYRNGAGISTPRVAADQYYASTKIPYSQMRPGDLIFWDRGSGISHVAIFSGNGMMVEAPSAGKNVRETPIRWSGTVAWAGRY